MSKKLWLDKKPETNKDWLVILCSCILFYLVLGALGSLLEFAGVLMSILSPFAGGVVLAYILDPFVRWMSGGVLHNNPRMRWLSILCAYLLLLLLIFLLSWLVVPQVGTSMGTLFTSLPGYVANVQKLLLELQAGYGVNLQGVVDALDDYEQLMTNLYNMVAGAAPEIMATLQTAASNLVAVFTAVASSIYMLAGKEKLLHQLRTVIHAVLPRGMAEQTLRICRSANTNITGFLVGKIIDAAIMALILFVGMSILNISFAPLIAVLMGITNIIPVFGPFIGAIPSIAILLFANPVQALEFLVLVVCVQQVDSNFIAPKILGQSVGLSALWVLFAVVLGANLFGVVGMVLGVPVFATLCGLVHEFIAWCLDRRGIDEEGVRIVKPESAASAAVHIQGDEDAPSRNPASADPDAQPSDRTP